jgi:uncharacterized membrane protein
VKSRQPRDISVRQAFAFAWPAFRNNCRLLIAVLLSMFAAWALLEAVVIAGQRFGLLFWAATHLAFLVFFSGTEIGFIRVCLAVDDRQAPVFRDAFSCLALGPEFLAAQLLYALMVTVGLLLGVVPGLYFAARYMFIGYSMADGEKTLKRAFLRSASITQGLEFDLIVVLLFLVVFNILGASLLGVGLLVTLPVSALMMAYVFRRLTRAEGRYASP